jgi:oxazoline/thiazoline synthase
VSQFERIKSEQATDIAFIARYNFSPRPEALDAPQARLIADSYGKGSPRTNAKPGALMQAVERYCGIFQGDEIRTTVGSWISRPPTRFLPTTVSC